MILPDVNLLIYVVNQDSAGHERALRWWQDVVESRTATAFTDVTLLGFLRIATSARLLPQPLSAAQALDQVGAWLAMSHAHVVRPTERHWVVLDSLIRRVGVSGNLTTDAHLAALAVEHGITVASADTDFARFHGIRWVNPLA